MTKIVGYCRVSTKEQAQEGISLEAQHKKLQAYAEAMDLNFVAIYEDAGLSAKSLARPGLQKALQSLSNGTADGILITKLDRLTRSVKDLGTLVETHFSGDKVLLSVSDSIDTRSAAGRLVLNVLVSVAQWEREIISERTIDALSHLKSKGIKLGQRPLGTTPDEVATLERLVQLRNCGLSLREVARVLTAEGHRPKKCGRWHPKTVAAVYRRVVAEAVGTF